MERVNVTRTVTGRLRSSVPHIRSVRKDDMIRQRHLRDGGGRTGLMVRASDSGSGDPGSILGRVGVLFP